MIPEIREINKAIEGIYTRSIRRKVIYFKDGGVQVEDTISEEAQKLIDNLVELRDYLIERHVNDQAI